MKVKVILFLTVFPKILLSIVAAFAVDENYLSRSTYFRTQQNKKLIGHVIQRFESPSLMSCSRLCMRNTWCSSTNFEQLTGRVDKGTCELNKHDISPVNEHTNFQDQQGCTFSLHLKGCLMTGCLNGGSCLFDEEKDTFTCSCKLPWTGEDCGVKMEYHFTTLNTTGNTGPTSNAGYKGSSLENINVTNGLQEWSAPLTDYYHVDMCGASGGGFYGGKGARVNGTVHLEEGTKLTVLVGQRGAKLPRPHYAGGGGGGSFVVFSSNSTPLSIAGGGGGQPYLGRGGGPGQAGEAEGLKLGTVGQGGRLICAGPCYLYELIGVSSGGGLRGDGECFSYLHSNHSMQCYRGATTAKSFLNGGGGGSQFYHSCCDGGFGGGGASSRFIPGGGGGYSGGSVNATFNYHYHPVIFATGGGGSFVPRETWNAESGACAKGDGYVTLRFLGNSP